MNEQAPLASLVPSLHVVRAALHVASILGERPAPLRDARESYWHHSTGGTFSPADLRLGEQLLIECRLVVQRDGELLPSEELSALLEGGIDDAVAFVCHCVLAEPVAAADGSSGSLDALSSALAPLIVDEDRRRELLLELGRLFDDTRQSLIGAIGEDCVVDHARRELRELGHDELARAVRRVSLISDQIGYDVVAPRIDGPPRLLEVKTTAHHPDSEFEFFLSRNEITTGLRSSDWALVACAVLDEDERRAEILGWVTAADLRECLPNDVEHGRWTQAQLSVPLERLLVGLPRVVA